MQLTKKYRIWWDKLSLNIQNNHEKNYSGTTTSITDPNNVLGFFESNNLQDILDKIETEHLNVIGEHVSYNPNI